MTPEKDNVAGLTPHQWEERLEHAAGSPDQLATALVELEHEMRQESTWLHENPAPGGLVKAIIDFFGEPDHDVEALGTQINEELDAERRLKRRYRSWMPGEDYLDVLFGYLKDFGERVEPDAGGLQFPGFDKYKGIKTGKTTEILVLYLSKKFPGRDPANFHVAFDPEDGGVVLKRVYKMELPRIEGITTVGRSVLAELIGEITPSIAVIRQFVVDNAANRATRAALMTSHPESDGVKFTVRPDADPAATPLGHLMQKLAAELGLVPGTFRVFAQPFGMLRIEMDVERASSGKRSSRR